MKAALLQLTEDFMSSLVFLGIYIATGDLGIAVGFALAVGIAQIAWTTWHRRPIELVQWLSLALVVVLGGAALMTNDPRFVMAKPSVIHFAIGAVMLRRGWMVRYMPPVIRDRLPESVMVISGYAWAGLMFFLGLSNLYVAAQFSLAVWGWFIAIGTMGAKVLAFTAQYATFRILIRRDILKPSREQATLVES